MPTAAEIQGTVEALRGLGIVGFLILTALFAFLVFLAVLWTLLPFAVFGIKRRLDSLSGRLTLACELLGQVKDRLPDPLPPVPPRSGRGTETLGESWLGYSSERRAD